MSTPTLKLLSMDGKSFEVPVEIAKCSMLIKNMLDDLGMGEGDDVIPLPNVNSIILEKVIRWATHHKDDAPPLEANADQQAEGQMRVDDIIAWDQEFLNGISQASIYHMILAANYLDIKALLDLCCKQIAIMIMGKTTKQIRATFNINNNFSPEEEEQIRMEQDGRRPRKQEEEGRGEEEQIRKGLVEIESEISKRGAEEEQTETP